MSKTIGHNGLRPGEDVSNWRNDPVQRKRAEELGIISYNGSGTPGIDNDRNRVMPVGNLYGATGDGATGGYGPGGPRPGVGPGGDGATGGHGPAGGGVGVRGVATPGVPTAGAGLPQTKPKPQTGGPAAQAVVRGGPVTSQRLAAALQGVTWGPLVGSHNQNRLDPYLENKATGGLMGGFSYQANPGWSNVEDWAEARYGDFGSVPFAIAGIGADLGYNARRAYDHLSSQPQVQSVWSSLTAGYDSSPWNPSNRPDPGIQETLSPWEANATAREGEGGTVWRTGGGF